MLFPGHEQRAALEMEQVGHEPASIWDVGIADGAFIRYTQQWFPKYTF